MHELNVDNNFFFLTLYIYVLLSYLYIFIIFLAHQKGDTRNIKPGK